MGIISEVKCSRCDRRFSGLRGRCPYCGARRGKNGKRVADGDNSMWKLIVGVLILLVLIAAVIVLIMSTLKDKDVVTSTTTTDTQTITSTGDLEGEGVNSVEGDTTTNTGTVTGTETDTDTSTQTNTAVSVEKVTITYGGSETVDFTIKTTDPPLTLKCVTVPADAEEPVIWESSDENVFVVLQTGKVTAIGKGDATLTVTCGDATAECIVRVK
ncbi:MAG: Ig domain-containing protein [Oscillospiraceae bacterium]